MKHALRAVFLGGVVMRRAADDAGSPLEDVHQVGSLERHRAQLVSLCVVAVSVLLFLHYTAALHQLGIHDVLRRLFYFPVIVAAIVAGRRGGLAVAGFAALGFVPHLRQLARAGDRAMDSVFDLVLLLLIGTLVGAYADASRRARRKAAERGRLAALGETGLALMAQTEGPLAAIAGQAESLAGIANHSRSDATAFATRIIREEVARVRHLLRDLGELARVSQPRQGRIDLGALVVGVVESTAKARRDDRRAVVLRPAHAYWVQTDRRALAFSLRTLVFGLLDTIPPPGWLEVQLSESSPGQVAIELGVFSIGTALPDLEESLTRVFGIGSSDYQFRQILCVHVLASLGATVRFHSVSPCHARILVEFRDMPARAVNSYSIPRPGLAHFFPGLASQTGRKGR